MQNAFLMLDHLYWPCMVPSGSNLFLDGCFIMWMPPRQWDWLDLTIIAILGRLWQTTGIC
jgi:hypothetical protein